jgi:hypothetical protein
MSRGFYLIAKNGSPFRGIIREKHEGNLLDPKWGIEVLDDNEAHVVASESVLESFPVVG